MMVRFCFFLLECSSCLIFSDFHAFKTSAILFLIIENLKPFVKWIKKLNVLKAKIIEKVLKKLLKCKNKVLRIYLQKFK